MPSVNIKNNKEMKQKTFIFRTIFIYLLTSIPTIGYSEEKILSDCFYKLKDNKNKEIGYIHYIIKEGVYQNELCYEVLKEDELQIKWLFVKGNTKGREKAYISKGKGVLYFERIEIWSTSSLFKCKEIINITGRRDKDHMLIQEKRETVWEEEELKNKKEPVKESRKEINIAGVDYSTYELDIPIIMKPIIKLAVGEKKKIRVFDPEMQTIIEVKIEVKGKAKIKISGKEYESYVIQSKFDRDFATTWISEDGKIVLKRKDSKGERELSDKSLQ